jgi:hypothetical protein
MAKDRPLGAYMEAMGDLWRLLRDEEIGIVGFDSRESTIQGVLTGLEEDHRLTPVDAMIVAAALMNDDCTGFLTIDREIVRNRMVRIMMKQRGKWIRHPDSSSAAGDYAGCGNPEFSVERITFCSAQSPPHVRVDALP